MSILKVARMGHPILREIAKPVDDAEIKTREFQQFLDDMIETMREYDGVGLAAPQVHRSVRVCVIEIPEDNRYKKKGGLTGLQVFINPELKALTEETSSMWEGCLSVPGLRGLVSRPNKVELAFTDREGKFHKMTVEGFLAVVLQHEFDHLDGKLYIDRITDMRNLAFDQEFERYLMNSDSEVSD